MKTICLFVLILFSVGCGYSSNGKGTVAPGAPVIASLAPNNTPMGGAAFTMTVNGTGFASGAVVYWSGTSRTTTFVSSTKLTAAITAADIGTAQTVLVFVKNPGARDLHEPGRAEFGKRGFYDYAVVRSRARPHRGCRPTGSRPCGLPPDLRPGLSSAADSRLGLLLASKIVHSAGLCQWWIGEPLSIDRLLPHGADRGLGHSVGPAGISASLTAVRRLFLGERSASGCRRRNCLRTLRSASHPASSLLR